MQNRHQRHIRLDDIVLMHDENLPRLTWRKEIVVVLLKGPDGKMRRAEVTTPNRSIWKRPVTSCFWSNISNVSWMRMLERIRMRMWTRMCATIWYEQNEMQQLLEKYVGDLLTINSWLFYIGWFLYYFRKIFEPVTFLRGEYKIYYITHV